MLSPRFLAIPCVMAATILSGCVVAAVPVIAGAAVASSEAQRGKRTVTAKAPAAASSALAVQVTVGDPATATPPVAAEFAPLLDHVRSRATLWREGAPIKSLVLDTKQTVLNPIAIDCQRRQPVVLIDLDPATGSLATPLGQLAATPGWPTALIAIRDLDVGIIWVTDRPASDTAAIRDALLLTALDPMRRDQIAARQNTALRKQDVRLDQARTHCVLAVVGDKRGDADEAYDFLRRPDARLPIDDNWGAGWFLLPPALTLARAG